VPLRAVWLASLALVMSPGRVLDAIDDDFDDELLHAAANSISANTLATRADRILPIPIRSAQSRTN
jgi:hypothetical protein